MFFLPILHELHLLPFFPSSFTTLYSSIRLHLFHPPPLHSQSYFFGSSLFRPYFIPFPFFYIYPPSQTSSSTHPVLLPLPISTILSSISYILPLLHDPSFRHFFHSFLLPSSSPFSYLSLPSSGSSFSSSTSSLAAGNVATDKAAQHTQRSDRNLPGSLRLLLANGFGPVATRRLGEAVLR